MAHEASWTGRASIKGSTESMRMALLTFCIVGIQFTWGTEMTYCTPYLLQLGLTKSRVSLVWIAGPLSGLIVQPIVGIIADKSTSKWGRRRPFIFGGTAIVCLCLFVLGWTTEIVEVFIPDSEKNKSIIVLLAVLSIYGVDFAINVVQASCRSLIVDTLPMEKQQTGSAWATRMAAGGQLVGYVLGALNLQQIFGDLLGNTQFKQVVFIAGLALVLSICVTSWAVTEKVLLSPEISEKGQRDSPTAMLMQIVRTTLNLPARMRAICWIQFWSWVGWFPFLFYSTTWVGEIYLRYHAKTSGKVSEDHLAEIGRVGSTSLVVFSSIMMCGSLLLPFLVETPEENVLLMPRSPSAPPSPGLNARRKPTLLTAWIWSSLLFGVTLMVTPLVSTIRTAAFIVAVCGLPWTFASWAPFTFMGVEINRLSADPIPLTVDRSSERLSITMIDSQDEVVAKRVSLLGDDKAAQEEMAGIYLGILNLFTTLPQFVGTFISMIVFRLLEPGKSPELTEDPHNRHPPENGVNAIAVCMFIGGICSLIASHLTRKLRRMR